MNSTMLSLIIMTIDHIAPNHSPNHVHQLRDTRTKSIKYVCGLTLHSFLSAINCTKHAMKKHTTMINKVIFNILRDESVCITNELKEEENDQWV